MRTYPEDYKGPKAGISFNEEWLAVREYQVFKWILDGTWAYSDFDCWLGARDEWHYNKGEERCLNALKEFQKMCSIKAEINPQCNKNNK